MFTEHRTSHMWTLVWLDLWKDLKLSEMASWEGRIWAKLWRQELEKLWGNAVGQVTRGFSWDPRLGQSQRLPVWDGGTNTERRCSPLAPHPSSSPSTLGSSFQEPLPNGPLGPSVRPGQVGCQWLVQEREHDLRQPIRAHSRTTEQTLP